MALSRNQHEPNPSHRWITVSRLIFIVFILNINEYFLILATDGLWDMVTDQEAVDTVVEAMKKKENAGTALLKKSLIQSSFDGENLLEKMNNSLQVI